MTDSINIAADFTRYPAGRNVGDGPYSGEHFRKQFLLPVMQTGRRVRINFDGTRGYGSSFLEEAFGGLVREEGFKAEDVLKAFDFQSSDESLIDEIKEYIADAG